MKGGEGDFPEVWRGFRNEDVRYRAKRGGSCARTKGACTHWFLLLLLHHSLRALLLGEAEIHEPDQGLGQLLGSRGSFGEGVDPARVVDDPTSCDLDVPVAIVQCELAP